jgi:hypothetical protein
MRGDPAALVLVPGLILCFAGLNAAPKLPYLKILFHKIKFGWIRTGKKSSVFMQRSEARSRVLGALFQYGNKRAQRLEGEGEGEAVVTLC